MNHKALIYLYMIEVSIEFLRSKYIMLGLVLIAVLFFLLTPGILLSLPKKGSKYTVAATHAVVFVVVAYLLKRIFRSLENMEDMENTENTENTDNTQNTQNTNEGFQEKESKMGKAPTMMSDTKAARNAAAMQM